MRYGHVAVGLAGHGNALEAGQKQRFSENSLPANACFSDLYALELQLRRDAASSTSAATETSLHVIETYREEAVAAS